MKTNNQSQIARVLISLVLMGAVSSITLADSNIDAEMLLEIEQQLEGQSQLVGGEIPMVLESQTEEIPEPTDEAVELDTSNQHTWPSASHTTNTSTDDDPEHVAPNYAQTKKNSLERMQRIKRAFQAN